MCVLLCICPRLPLPVLACVYLRARKYVRAYLSVSAWLDA